MSRHCGASSRFDIVAKASSNLNQYHSSRLYLTLAFLSHAMSYTFDMALAGATPTTSTTTTTSSSSSPTTAASLADIKELQVRFTSRLTSIPPLPSSPFTIPVHLTRYGLSQILNHLLTLPQPRPFDFLIDGRFLRSSLRDVLRERGEVGEAGLLVEVVEAVGRPDVQASNRPHPDWLASVWQLPRGEVLTGCYDRHVRVVRHATASAKEEERDEMNQAEEEETEVLGSGHTSAVKCVRAFPSPLSAASSVVLSASKDQTVRVWDYNHTSHTLQPVAIGRAHTASVESLAVLEGLTKFVSGGHDKLIYVWDTSSRTAATVSVEQSTVEGDGASKRRNKRVKQSQLPLAELQPLAVISGSTDVITGLTSPFPTTLLSCSFDTSLRVYDLPTQQQTRVWHIGGGKPLSSVDVSADGRLAALGCWDGAVRLVDVRAAEAKAVTALASHTGVVSSVSFSGVDGFHVASGSYDGNVKVWDVRARVPLTTVKGSAGGEDDKVLSVCWGSGGTAAGGAGGTDGSEGKEGRGGHGVIWSGGSDRVLRQFRWKSRVETETEE